MLSQCVAKEMKLHVAQETRHHHAALQIVMQDAVTFNITTGLVRAANTLSQYGLNVVKRRSASALEPVPERTISLFVMIPTIVANVGGDIRATLDGVDAQCSVDKEGQRAVARCARLDATAINGTSQCGISTSDTRIQLGVTAESAMHVNIDWPEDGENVVNLSNHGILAACHAVTTLQGLQHAVQESSEANKSDKAIGFTIAVAPTVVCLTNHVAFPILSMLNTTCIRMGCSAIQLSHPMTLSSVSISGLARSLNQGLHMALSLDFSAAAIAASIDLVAAAQQKKDLKATLGHSLLAFMLPHLVAGPFRRLLPPDLYLTMWHISTTVAGIFTGIRAGMSLQPLSMFGGSVLSVIIAINLKNLYATFKRGMRHRPLVWLFWLCICTSMCFFLVDPLGQLFLPTEWLSSRRALIHVVSGWIRRLSKFLT